MCKLYCFWLLCLYHMYLWLHILSVYCGYIYRISIFTKYIPCHILWLFKQFL